MPALSPRPEPERIYLDHAATTPMLPEAREAFVDAMGRSFGNPSGVHREAREARTLLEDSRDRLAAVLGANAHEIVFTGGGTEAVNLALRGVRPVRLLWSAIEHDAVRASAAALQRDGFQAEELAVDRHGVLDLDRLSAALAGIDDRSAGNNTAPDAMVRDTVVAVMAVNNEVGTVQPIESVAQSCRRTGAVLVVDAVQALTWIDLRPITAATDLVAISAHKFGGPKGVGALVVRNGRRLVPILHGGGQEQERRSGTQNVAGIVAMAAAAESTDANRSSLITTVAALRDRLVDELVTTIDGCIETVPRAMRVAGNAHVCIAGVESEELLIVMDRLGVAASAGSACASGALHLSPVLAAIGVDTLHARGALRCTLGVTTTERDVADAAAIIRAAVAQLRGGAG